MADDRRWWDVTHDPDTRPGARARWAASGAMALTGDAGGPPLVAPAAVVRRIERLGEAVGVDALALLAERAALAGYGRRGATSCGGATRLLRTTDGWVAVSLARQDDVDLVPAWLEVDAPPEDAWTAVVAAAARGAAGELVDRGRLLGLPVARVGEVEAGGDPVVREWVGDAAPGPERSPGRAPLVVDLSSLWAGPLCARILGAHGAAVVKVEATRRPDGARRGPGAFFDLLHVGHRAVAVDLDDRRGVDALGRLLGAADVVIEGSRPRALEHLGLAARAVVAAGPRVWVSITGHGRSGPGRDRVAFGDDAAAAGGLVAWGADGRPRFVADAVADPLTGIAAAGAALAALADGGRCVLDVALARVAAAVAGPHDGGVEHGWVAGEPGEAAPPRTLSPAGRARALGADTAAVLAELGLACADEPAPGQG
jgi:hypothetical protein